MMQVGLSNYQFGNSNVVARANNKKAEKKTEDKYASVSAYQAYLKDKYPCLSASNYKVTISPALLEKCIRDPEKAELLEKNLEILPGCHQNMIAAWNALGADVKNEEWKKCFKIIGTDFSIGWCHTNQLGRRCSISFWNGTLYVCDVFDRQYFSLYWRDTFFH